LAKNRVYIPALFVLNKADLANIKRKPEGEEGTIKNPLLISAKENFGIDRLLQKIWEKLKFYQYLFN